MPEINLTQKPKKKKQKKKKKETENQIPKIKLKEMIRQDGHNKFGGKRLPRTAYRKSRHNKN